VNPPLVLVVVRCRSPVSTFTTSTTRSASVFALSAPRTVPVIVPLE
jgi:hypothetical protein